MDEDHGGARGLPQLEIAEAPAADLDELGLRALATGLGRGRGEARLELGDEGVDLGVRDRGVGDDGQQRSHRHRLALAHQPPPQGPATGLSKTLAIFEVSMSAISWPLATSCPPRTCHAASMPSCIARPHLGMTMGWISAISAPSPPPRGTAASILAGLGM